LTAGSLCYSTNAGGAGIGGMLYSDGASWQRLAGGSAVYSVGSSAAGGYNDIAARHNVAGMTMTKNFKAGNINVTFSCANTYLSPGAATAIDLYIVIDGADVAHTSLMGATPRAINFGYTGPVTSGNHTIKVQVFYDGAGQINLDGSKTLTAMETL
jgi:hypothetical protein